MAGCGEPRLLPFFSSRPLQPGQITFSSEGSNIAGNVRFAGIDLSGLSIDQAELAVTDRARLLLDTPITVLTGGEPLVATAEQLGFVYETSIVVDQAIAARHDGSVLGVFVDWAKTPFNEIEIEDVIVFDPDAALELLATTPEMIVSSPV